MSEVLTLSHVQKIYYQGQASLEVLRDVQLSLQAGETLALIGPSGCGKTTLLQIAGLLDTPTAGRVVIAGEDASKANDAKRTKLRERQVGFVYQFHHLLPEFSALENVMLPQLIAGKTAVAARKRAMELLESLKLSARAGHRPARLSGGEQQRVAIARALANTPALLLADEPTGNLDPDTAEEVFALLLNTVREHRLAVLMVTHNAELARKLQRVVSLKHGMVERA